MAQPMWNTNADYIAKRDALLALEEGNKTTVYFDTVGHPTIGKGIDLITANKNKKGEFVLHTDNIAAIKKVLGDTQTYRDIVNFATVATDAINGTSLVYKMGPNHKIKKNAATFMETERGKEVKDAFGSLNKNWEATGDIPSPSITQAQVDSIFNEAINRREKQLDTWLNKAQQGLADKVTARQRTALIDYVYQHGSFVGRLKPRVMADMINGVSNEELAKDLYDKGDPNRSRHRQSFLKTGVVPPKHGHSAHDDGDSTTTSLVQTFSGLSRWLTEAENGVLTFFVAAKAKIEFAANAIWSLVNDVFTVHQTQGSIDSIVEVNGHQITQRHSTTDGSLSVTSVSNRQTGQLALDSLTLNGSTQTSGSVMTFLSGQLTSTPNAQSRQAQAGVLGQDFHNIEIGITTGLPADVATTLQGAASLKAEADHLDFLARRITLGSVSDRWLPSFLGDQSLAQTYLMTNSALAAQSAFTQSLINSYVGLNRDFNIIVEPVEEQLITPCYPIDYSFCQPWSYFGLPLVLDLDGNGITLLPQEQSSAYFDISNTGAVEKTSWIGAGNGILVFDKNHNGIIDNASEWFGQSFTANDLVAPTSQTGFEALATLANAGATVFSSATGKIDPNTGKSYFNELKVWVDANQNGQTEAGELHTLKELGIASINLGAKLLNEQINGNILGSVGSYTLENGVTRKIDDIGFTGMSTAASASQDNSVNPSTAALAFLQLTNMSLATKAAGSALGIATAVDAISLDFTSQINAMRSIMTAEQRIRVVNGYPAPIFKGGDPTKIWTTKQQYSQLVSDGYDAPQKVLDKIAVLASLKNTIKNTANSIASGASAVMAAENAAAAANLDSQGATQALQRANDANSAWGKSIKDFMACYSVFDQFQAELSILQQQLNKLMPLNASAVGHLADGATFWSPNDAMLAKYTFLGASELYRAFAELQDSLVSIVTTVGAVDGYGAVYVGRDGVTLTANDSQSLFLAGAGSETFNLSTTSRADVALTAASGDVVIRNFQVGAINDQLIFLDVGNSISIGSDGNGNTVINYGSNGHKVTLLGLSTEDIDLLTNISGVSRVSFSDQDSGFASLEGMNFYDGRIHVNAITASSTGDSLVTGQQGSVLTGGVGNDGFIVAGNSYVIDGGGGENDISYQEVLGGVSVNLQTGQDNMGGKIRNIQDVTGSVYDDQIIGGREDNVLDGGGGRDFLLGRGGEDNYIFSSQSTSTLIIENGSDTDGKAARGVLSLGDSFSASDLWFSRLGDSLRITILGTDSSIVVRDWFVYDYRKLSAISLADGQAIATDKIEAALAKMEAHQKKKPNFDPQKASTIPMASLVPAFSEDGPSPAVISDVATIIRNRYSSKSVVDLAGDAKGLKVNLNKLDSLLSICDGYSYWNSYSSDLLDTLDQVKAVENYLSHLATGSAISDSDNAMQAALASAVTANKTPSAANIVKAGQDSAGVQAAFALSVAAITDITTQLAARASSMQTLQSYVDGLKTAMGTRYKNQYTAWSGVIGATRDAITAAQGAGYLGKLLENLAEGLGYGSAAWAVGPQNVNAKDNQLVIVAGSGAHMLTGGSGQSIFAFGSWNDTSVNTIAKFTAGKMDKLFLAPSGSLTVGLTESADGNDTLVTYRLPNSTQATIKLVKVKIEELSLFESIVGANTADLSALGRDVTVLLGSLTPRAYDGMLHIANVVGSTAHSNNLTGDARDNTLTGGNLADVLNGSSGTDVLIGGKGGDSYLFNAGWGQDTIIDNDTTANTVDKIIFGSGISAGQLWFSRNGNDLEIVRAGSSDKVVVKSWYLGAASKIEQIRTGDRKILTSDKVDALVTVMASYRSRNTAFDPTAAVLAPINDNVMATAIQTAFSNNLVTRISSGNTVSITTTDFDGNVTTINYANNGVKLSDSWQLANGRRGVDTYNADGSSLGSIYNTDGSYTNYITDKQGNTTRKNYDKTNKLRSTTTAHVDPGFGQSVQHEDGSSSGWVYSVYGVPNEHYFDNGQGQVTSYFYNENRVVTGYQIAHAVVDGIQTIDKFTLTSVQTGYVLKQSLADGSLVTHDYDTQGQLQGHVVVASNAQGEVVESHYDADDNLLFYVTTTQVEGVYSASKYQADGTLIEFSKMTDIQGVVTITMYDATGGVMTGYSVLSTDEQGQALLLDYNAAHVKVADNTLNIEGVMTSQLYDSVSGSLASAITHQVNGHYTVVSTLSDASVRTVEYDAYGQQLSVAQTSPVAEPPEEVVTEQHDVDGNYTGYTRTQTNAAGEVLVQHYDADDNLLTDGWSMLDGAHGNNIFNEDGSSSGSNYMADGSYTSYTDNGIGERTVRNFDMNGELLGYSREKRTGSNDVVTTQYSSTGIALGDEWRKADGSSGHDSFGLGSVAYGTSYMVNGSYVSYSKSAVGHVVEALYDADGNLTGRRFTFVDGLDQVIVTLNAAGAPVSESKLLADGSRIDLALVLSESGVQAIATREDGSYSVVKGLQNGSQLAEYTMDGILLQRLWYGVDDAGIDFGADYFGVNGSSHGFHSAAPGYLSYQNDGAGTQSESYFNEAGVLQGSTVYISNEVGIQIRHYNAEQLLITESWTYTDGRHGDRSYNTDGSSTSVSYSADGRYSTVVDNGFGELHTDYFAAGGSLTGISVRTAEGNGTVTTVDYTAGGVKLRDSWSAADNTHGVDSFAADGSSEGTVWQADDSYSHYINDGQGVIITKHYSATDILLDQEQQTTDAVGNVFTLIYSADGVKQGDSWSHSDGSHGSNAYTVIGMLSSGTSYHTDGSHETFTVTGHGVLDLYSFDVSGQATGYSTQTWDSSIERVTTHFYNATGVLLGDRYYVSGADFSDVVGFDVFREDGSSHGSSYDDYLGTTAIYNDDGHGRRTTNTYDWQNHLSSTELRISNADGITLSSVHFNSDGSKFWEDIWRPDHSRSTTAYSADGLVTITQFDSNHGRRLSDSWTRPDGSHGTDSFASNNSSSGIAYAVDGSYSNYTNDGAGSVFTTYYTIAGVRVQICLVDASGTTNSYYTANGNTLSNRTFLSTSGQSAYTANYNSSGICVTNWSSAVTMTLPTGSDNLTLIGNGNINGTGNALANALIGNVGNNTLNGGTGADTLIGGLGDDIYVVDNISDVTTENLNEGLDRVQSSITWTLAANVENLLLTGTTAINGTGNALDNTLTGNTAANVLKGGLGNDNYVVGTGDTTTENLNEGIDTVQSSITWTLAANVENLLLAGTTAINGTGNTLDNILTGNSAANVLTGGEGNDTYVVGTGDTVTESTNEGIDTVQSALTWSLANNIENLTLTGTTAINGTGNTLANTLIGNIANNTLTGLVGNDTYVFDAGWATDTIVDNDATVNNVDIARFGSGISRDQLWFKTNGSSLEITRIGTTDKLIVSNWYTSTAYHVEQFKTNDNFTLDHNKVAQLVQAMSAMTAPPVGQTTLTTAQHQQLDSVIASSWV